MSNTLAKLHKTQNQIQEKIDAHHAAGRPETNDYRKLLMRELQVLNQIGAMEAKQTRNQKQSRKTARKQKFLMIDYEYERQRELYG